MVVGPDDGEASVNLPVCKTVEYRVQASVQAIWSSPLGKSGGGLTERGEFLVRHAVQAKTECCVRFIGVVHHGTQLHGHIAEDPGGKGAEDGDGTSLVEPGPMQQSDHSFVIPEHRERPPGQRYSHHAGG